MPDLSHLTYLRAEGTAPMDRVSDAMQLALRGCDTLHAEMRKALAKGGGGGGEAAEGVSAEGEAGEDGEADGVGEAQANGDAQADGDAAAPPPPSKRKKSRR